LDREKKRANEAKEGKGEGNERRRYEKEMNRSWRNDQIGIVVRKYTKKI
jgi:hypothetical protein